MDSHASTLNVSYKNNFVGRDPRKHSSPEFCHYTAPYLVMTLRTQQPVFRSQPGKPENTRRFFFFEALPLKDKQLKLVTTSFFMLQRDGFHKNTKRNLLWGPMAGMGVGWGREQILWNVKQGSLGDSAALEKARAPESHTGECR